MSTEHRRAARGMLALAMLLTPTALVHAQWRTTTGIDLGETYSDNVNRQSPSRAQENWGTEISPWLRGAGQSARLTGSLDLRVQNWINSNTANRSALRGSTNGTLALIEDHLDVDGGASRDRQQVSQFAAPDASYAAPSNSTEVTRTWVSPALYTRFGNAGYAAARYRFENVDSERTELSGQNSTATLDIANGAAFGRLGWGFSGRHYSTTAKATQATSSDSYNGSLTYAVTPEMTATLFGGQEFNDYAGGQRQHTWNWGAGLKWQPTERTTLNAQTTKRFFGRGFSYGVSQRWRRSVFDWSYERDVNSFSNTAATNGLAVNPEVYTVYFAQYQAALAKVSSSVTDPVQKELLALLILQGEGVPVFVANTKGYLSSQTYTDKRMRLSWRLEGQRNLISLSGYTSDRETLTQQILTSSATGSSDDLIQFSRVKQRGWNVDWRHDLSARTSTGLRYGYTDTSGYANNGARTTTHVSTWGLSLSNRLGVNTTGILGYTHTQSRGANADYRENAISATLSHRF
ncbi:MAG: TIGR03016 family PEP-CTERM system-associated outer membrane protein [Rhodocyclaceae bacterium]